MAQTSGESKVEARSKGMADAKSKADSKSEEKGEAKGTPVNHDSHIKKALSMIQLSSQPLVGTGDMPKTQQLAQ